MFDCMEHLPVHLANEARLGGPAQYRWMYPFERFINHLKSKMKNKRYVEGSICDAYLVEETTHFAPFYFEDNVQSRRTQIGQNLNDGGIDTSLPTTLSVFNRPGRPIGAKGQRYLNNKERFAAHQYILLNYEEVQPILSLYETGLRQYNPGVTDEDIDNEVEKNFASWFRDYVYNPGNNICNQSLIDLACGPLLQATTYNGLVVNGFKFQTEEQCVRKSTNNFGVSIKGTSLSHDESFFFDTLKEVVEIEYPNIPLKRVMYKRKLNWWIVLNVRPRGTIDSAYKHIESYQHDSIPMPTYGVGVVQEGGDDLLHNPLVLTEVEVNPIGSTQGLDNHYEIEDESEKTEQDDEVVMKIVRTMKKRMLMNLIEIVKKIE
nr:uncharacterized protein LOC109185082 [Ipomoea trifida]